MKKFTLIFILALIIQAVSFSQPCPDSLIITSQAQIDSFPINYPGCTEIEGYVAIIGSDITNLDGLNVLTSIGDSLYIESNDALISLVGLENVTFIGGGLWIINNTSLSTCEAPWLCDYLSNPNGSVNISRNADGCNSVVELGNACGGSIPCLPYGAYSFSTQSDIDNFQLAFPDCKELEGYVVISGSDITNLNGLGEVTSVEDSFWIDSNGSLTSLTGLEGLTSLGSSLYIQYNVALTSLTGMDNVTSIGGDLGIVANNALTSLSGLDNLASLGGDLFIGNFDGNSTWTFGNGNSLLKDISSLSNLTSIAGNIAVICNPSLTSLAGLHNITSVGGNIWIGSNDSLVNLFPVSNLDTIQGYLMLGIPEWSVNPANPYLPDLSGLDSLDYIGGSLFIAGNDLLNNLDALANLNFMGGGLLIEDNPALDNILGLFNLNADSITHLWIFDNSSLSSCEAQSICNYLSTPEGFVEIHSNAPGCNSPEEVEEACDTLSIEEIFNNELLSVYPNPANSELFISSSNRAIITEVTIYNQIGQKVLHDKSVDQPIDVSMLQSGMYSIEVCSQDFKAREKLIIR